MTEEFNWREILGQAETLRNVGQEEEEKLLLLVFPWGTHLYAIESKYVERVAHMPRVFSVPGAGPPIAGVVNLRGKVLPVLDPRSAFEVNHPRPLEESYMAFVRVDNIEAALVMDDSGSLERMPISDMKPTDVMPQKPYTRFLKGLVLQKEKDGEEQILLSVVDLESLIHSVAKGE